VRTGLNVLIIVFLRDEFCRPIATTMPDLLDVVDAAAIQVTADVTFVLWLKMQVFVRPTTARLLHGTPAELHSHRIACT